MLVRPKTSLMKLVSRFLLPLLGGVGLAGLFLWWLADHRRGIAWAVRTIRWRFSDVNHISVADLKAWLRDASRKPALFVDARTEEEFAVSHLPGAMRVNPKFDGETLPDGIDAERPVVVYCSAGYRGARLARHLQRIGHRCVWNLDGGIFAWGNDGMPLERDGRTVCNIHPFSRIFSRLLKPGKAARRIAPGALSPGV